MRCTSFLLCLLGAFQIGIACGGDLPDARLTPGAIDPGVTQTDIGQTVCVKGYTRHVRPPASYTNRMKKRQLRSDGYADRNPRHYEEDHLIPLSLGGSADDVRNLWPEPRLSEWNARRKDELEYALYKKVCAHQLGLRQAQNEIAQNWIEAYKKYGIHAGKHSGHVD